MKEVNSFISNDAVRKCLDKAEVKEAYDSNRIAKALPGSWRHPEEQAGAIKSAMDNAETIDNSSGTKKIKKAKARSVLLGFQHTSLLDRKFKIAAAVRSSLGRNLI